ncbi:MAG: carboxypeptidase-like regulatory domain-containing protein, partial [Planctomycetes bacterium]|nr:carboxypeptidase-like regulatory domain-containing protein [Planctomycetota bacterium]
MSVTHTSCTYGAKSSIARVCIALSLTVLVQDASSASVAGLVRNANGPIAGATVRVQATRNATTTDAEGHFELAGLAPNEPVLLTAWARGYYIGGGDRQFLPGASTAEITLTWTDVTAPPAD